MRLNFRNFALGAIGALALLAVAFVSMPSVVLSQSRAVPQVPNLGGTDLVPVVPGGRPTSQSQYATPAQIGGATGYYKSIPLTGFSFTIANSTQYMVFNPAGTLSNLYVTMAASPSDGQRSCIFSTQTLTALGITANTGQTINNAVTSLAANTFACYIFSRSNLTWDRSN